MSQRAARYSEQPTTDRRFQTMMNFSSSDGAMLQPGEPAYHANKTVMVGSDLDQTLSNQGDDYEGENT